MQNIVQIRKENTYFATNLFFENLKSSFGALGVESPQGGAMDRPDINKVKVMLKARVNPFEV